METLGNYN